MQNMSYIGDAINNKILRLKRPVTVPIDHLDQIYEWIGYITEGYLCCETNVPNDCAIMNAVYRMECAPIRTEYAKTHKRPEGPIDHFKSEMSPLGMRTRALPPTELPWEIMPNWRRLEPARPGAK